MYALHYANELLVRVRLSFQKLLHTRSTWRNNTEKIFKSSEDHDKPHFHSYVCMFFTTISTSKKMYVGFFFFRARAEKGIARHIDASSLVWTLVNFDWFLLSMRMQIILDPLFARPGSAPIRGGKKGEFRDWTMKSTELDESQSRGSCYHGLHGKYYRVHKSCATHLSSLALKYMFVVRAF